MRPRPAKARAKRGEVRRGEALLAEHQHRMFGEGLLDPGEFGIIEMRQVDPDSLGAKRLAERAEFRGVRSSAFSLVMSGSA